MRLGLIYKLSFTKNCKFLYGSTLNFNKRKKNYLNSLKRGDYPNKIVQRTFNKYGENSIKFEIVQDNIPEDILEEVENIWMGANCSKSDDKKGGMNLRDAKRGNFSESTKKKMSKWQTGRKLTKTHIENIKNNHISKSENYIPPMKGVVQDIQKQIKSSPNKIKVLQYSLYGNFIQLHESQRSAAKKLGNKKFSSGISRCCNNVISNAYGYIWKFYKEGEEIDKNISSNFRLPIKVFINNIYHGTFKTPGEIQRKLNISWNTIVDNLEGRKKSKKYKFIYEEQSL